MAHVELSLSESFTPDADASVPSGSLAHWAATVSGAVEPCLVINGLSEIVAISPAASTMLGFTDQAVAVGCHLFAGVIRLLDFTSAAARLPDSDIEKIPPILACSSGRLARGLLRVQAGDEVSTVDAIATPLFDGRKAVGSLTFFSQI
ncbi:MAG: hypothetical protein AUI14_08030 [Actinobacteria bacterium 13_2_20CM_2_71_6]|nr:MAG: hypothetical protein AUI14_08030 [Actinobacteria bacterium 13_2_20CM_2_71_6]